MKAMIFAAGLGTRLKEETQNKPKALVEIAGKPLLQHAIEKLKNTGISEIVINVHHYSDMIISWLCDQNFYKHIHVSDESGKLLDTGGGLKKAAPFLKGSEPVLIYNVDVISDIDLKLVEQEHIKHNALATLVVRKRRTNRYFKFDEQQRLVGWTNKKTGEIKLSRPVQLETTTEMAFSGIHIVQPEIFALMPEEDKFSITDLYLKLAENHLIKGYFDNSELWMDVGKPIELAEARKNKYKY